ncbi:hypothetical protein EDD86DRAFT_207264 [Gorgonomyces haynaldii]|nr:hypothetical protein EDD86DRAFT_207264 [Gorgonomyces haynaldii]
MLAYLVCMVRVWPALRQNKFYAKALYVAFVSCLVWNIFKLIYVYSDSPPWVSWVYSSLGLISQSLAVLIDGEILKAFCAISKVVTPKMVTRLQYCLLALHVTLAGSAYIRLLYLGTRFPNWLVLWYRYGYALFVILQQLLELWQILMIFWLAVTHQKQRNDIQRMEQLTGVEYVSKDHEQLQDVRRVLYILVGSLVILWLGGAVTAYDFFNTQSWSIDIQIIGNTVCSVSPILSCFVLEFIQNMNFKKNSKKGTSTPKLSQSLN